MSYDVYGIGNALVDSEYLVTEDILAKSGFTKGTMTLVDQSERAQLVTLLEDTEKLSMSKLAGGGSAANTVVTVALLGASSYYSCKVSDDKTGDFFVADLAAVNVDTNLGDQRPTGVTGECISMITPDGERTLVTHLGITQTFSPDELDHQALSSASYLYIEGYLISSPTALEAVQKAQAEAKTAGVKVALTLSDVGMVENFRPAFEQVFSTGVDILFCNEDEAKLWTGEAQREAAASALQKLCPQIAMTLSGDGALVTGGDGQPQWIQSEAVKPVDTTGAGDTFAGGVLYGLSQNLDLTDATALAHSLARQVVSRFGARLSPQEIAAILKAV